MSKFQLTPLKGSNRLAPQNHTCPRAVLHNTWRDNSGKQARLYPVLQGMSLSPPSSEPPVQGTDRTPVLPRDRAHPGRQLPGRQLPGYRVTELPAYRL